MPDSHESPPPPAPSSPSLSPSPLEVLRSLTEQAERRPWARVGVALAGLSLLAGAGWWLLRPPATPIEDRLPMASVPAPPPTVATTIVVQVAGAVRAPGVYAVQASARVSDVIDAAGGPTADADPDQLALAARLSDGQRVYVPRVGEVLPALPDRPAGAAASGPLDLNAATAAELESLPGIGPALAAAIVEHREREGRFGAVDDLLDVPGIGRAKLAALRDLVRV